MNFGTGGILTGIVKSFVGKIIHEKKELLFH